MLILLPPSETKREGGAGAPLRLDALAFPQLAPQRRAAMRAVRDLARDVDVAMAALKLGPTLRHEVDRNRTVGTSPTMPAIDRFTGVLYDGLDAGTLSEAERGFANGHVLIQSAMLGPIAALDEIPAYRLSFDSRLPGLTLKRHWAQPVARLLAASSGLMLDLRSEGYAALGPLPRRTDAVYLRVLTEDPGGRRRALNHFNKKAKGEFTRAVIQQGTDFADVAELRSWADSSGWRLEALPGSPGELALVV